MDLLVLNKKIVLTVALALVGALTPATGFAGEKIFGYSYTAEPFPKGAKEFYSWLTYRGNKGEGTYQALDIRQEFEYGWTDKTAVSLYINERYHKIKDAAPMEDGEPAYGNRESFNFQGFQVGVTHNVKSPYLDGYGLSFKLEPGYSTVFKVTGERQQEYALEGSIMYQKNYLDDTLVFVFNFTPEFEYRKFEHDTSWATELAVEATAGLSYRWRSNWTAGLEARYHSEYPDTKLPIEHYAVFLGPNIHYAKKNFWATFTLLPQVYGWMDDKARHAHLHLSEHEMMETRLILAWTL